MDPLHVSPIITLTTDFGLADHYVGTMKGVVLSRCREAQVVDVCHGVSRFSIWEGAYTISQAAPFFPGGTIHVVVVDPGVGTERKAILVEAAGQIFIAPDNGVLSSILIRTQDAVIREITDTNLFLPATSSTFHGRDIFAAVAGAIANGSARAEQVGRVIQNPVMLEQWQPEREGDGRWRGRVLSVDHFGNVITNLPVFGMLPGELAIETGRDTIRQQRKTFGEAAPGEVFLYAGSSGNLEIGINQASAAEALALQPGEPLTLVHLDPRV